MNFISFLPKASFITFIPGIERKNKTTKLLTIGFLALLALGMANAAKTSPLPLNVFVKNGMSRELTREFCRCSAAKELLNDVATLFNTVSIDVGSYPKSSAQFSGLALVNTDTLSPETAANLLQRTIDEQTFAIFIDEREDFTDETDESNSRLKSLVFELNNGLQKEHFNELEIQAYKGNLARDRYAIDKERLEWNTNQKTLEILAKCQPTWMNSYIIMKNPNFEDSLFSQEMHGHTDFMRRHWIDCCQKAYCKKHSDDTENCNRKKNEFIDYYAYMQKPEAVRHKIFLERISKNFHKASKNLQGEMLEKYGQELKLESTSKEKITKEEL